MEKKKEQDVLIVRDEKNGELGVVSGLTGDGTPKRVPAKPENASDFLKFDRHGDVLDNFFLNFFRQCKEPKRFGFYRVAAEQADKLLEVMKELLKNPDANKELLAPHKVDTSGYEKKAQEEQKQGGESPKQKETEQANERQTDSPQEQTQQKTAYRPIDENKINWQELEEKWGVKRDDLEQSGDLQKMLNYGRSDLVKVTPTFGGEFFELEARLSFRKDEEGNISLVPHFIRKEQKLDEYKGHKFSAEDKQNLCETGNLGRIVDLVDEKTGELIPSIISIDRKTHELTDMEAGKLRIPTKIGKTEITSQEQEILRAGLPLRNKLIERSDGRKFTATLQVNVEQRGVEFVPGTGRSPRTSHENREQVKETAGATGRRRNSWTDADGNIRPISKWKDVQFTESQKADYVAGKTIKLENATDREGNACTLYLKFDSKKGRPFASTKNPDNAQVVAPSNESRTQMAVNNKGKTNEATKHIGEPLQKGQTEPSGSKQQEQQKRGEKQEIKKSSKMKM